MPKIPFSGQSYQMPSLNFDAQRSINIYPVKSESGSSKSEVMMQGRPGLMTFLEVANFPLRGGITANDRNFIVGGNTLYEIFIDGTSASRGTLNSTGGMVSMAFNGLQVCIVDGPDGYIFTLATNVLVEITDPYFLGANTVDFIDGYFAFNKPDSQVYYISALYDGLTGDALDFASAEGSPDNLVAVKTVHQQLWLFGKTTTQIVTNTGNADFPFSTVQGVLIQYGCIAPFSVIQSANIVFWLGQDADGQAVVWKAEGYQPTRISTHAVEFALQGYGDLSNATAYSYQDQGHYFVVFNFPNNISWCYDVALNAWHERAYFSDGQYSRHRPNFHIFAYGKHLVGDYEGGILYNQSSSIYTDNGQYIRASRAIPYVSDDLEYLYASQIQLDMQTGIGLGEDFDSENPATNPRVVLDWSDDGGHTWSDEKYSSAGLIGQYGIRAIWRRLGRFRQRVFRFTQVAPCKVFWIAAHLQLEKGSN